jgi:hypothetical protein
VDVSEEPEEEITIMLHTNGRETNRALGQRRVSRRHESSLDELRRVEVVEDRNRFLSQALAEEG